VAAPRRLMLLLGLRSVWRVKPGRRPACRSRREDGRPQVAAPRPALKVAEPRYGQNLERPLRMMGGWFFPGPSLASRKGHGAAAVARSLARWDRHP
jgi:hypothetical protein